MMARTVTMKVLLQGPSLYGSVTVSGEGTRQHTDVAEGALCRLVKYLAKKGWPDDRRI